MAARVADRSRRVSLWRHHPGRPREQRHGLPRATRRHRVSKSLLVHGRQGQRPWQPAASQFLVAHRRCAGWRGAAGWEYRQQTGEGAQKDGNGTIFRIDTSGSSLYRASEFRRRGAICRDCTLSAQISPDGRMLYGMSAGGGNIAKARYTKCASTAPASTSCTTSIQSRGKEPHGTVVFDGASSLLGMTRSGGTLSDGSEGAGVIFRYDLTIGGTRCFTSSPRTPAITAARTITDSSALQAATTTVQRSSVRKLWAGRAFSLRDDGSDFSIVHSFGAAGDGKKPFGSLVQVGEWFYGTTTLGGDRDDGTIFRLRPSDLRYERMVSFDRATTGAFPEDNVIPSGDGSTLYGLTQARRRQRSHGGEKIRHRIRGDGES